MPRVHNVNHRKIGIASRKGLKRWQPKHGAGDSEWAAWTSAEVVVNDAHEEVASREISSSFAAVQQEQETKHEAEIKQNNISYRSRRRKRRASNSKTSNAADDGEEGGAVLGDQGESIEQESGHDSLDAQGSVSENKDTPFATRADGKMVTPPDEQEKEEQQPGQAEQHVKLRNCARRDVSEVKKVTGKEALAQRKKRRLETSGELLSDRADYGNDWIETLASNADSISPKRSTETVKTSTNESSRFNRDEFLSTRPIPPVPIADCAAISDDKKASRGYLSSPEDCGLEWWQIICQTMPNAFDMSFQIPDETPFESIWDTKQGRQLQWEAHVLTWIHRDRSDATSRFFAQPLDLLVSSDLPCRLSLRLEIEGEPAEILGTLEDVLVWNRKYDVNPIPEAVVAWFVLEILKAVQVLHQCNIAHNDLGLDSFLLIRNKRETDENDGHNWGLVCTGFGCKAAKIIKSEDQHFRHDLCSIVNIANLLLSGGEPLEVDKTNDGVIINRHWDRLAYGNPCIRLASTWEALFRALLNPPSKDHGLDMLDTTGLAVSTTWPELTSACEAFVSLVDQTNSFATSFLGVTVNRVRSTKDSGNSVPKRRFPVKLIELDPSEPTSTLQAQYDALLREKIEEQQQATQREQELQQYLAAAAERFDEYHRQAEAEKSRMRSEFEARLKTVQSDHQKELDTMRAEISARDVLLDDELNKIRQRAKKAQESHDRALQQLKETHSNEVHQLEESLSAEKAKTIKYDSDKCVLQEQISELMRQLGEKNEEVLWWQERETSVRQAEQELDQRTREADKMHAKKAEELKQRERACRESEERLRMMEAELRSSSAGTVASRANSQDTVVRQEEINDKNNAEQNHVAGRRSPRVKNAPVLCHLAALAAPKKKAKRQILITSSDSESDSDSD